MSRKVTVFVGAIGGGGHGDQILKALRLAGGDRYVIVGGDASPYCPQFADVDVPVILPKASDPSYFEAVIGLSKKFGVRAVFHGCEPELLALHRNRQVFSDEKILLPINPPDVIETCMDKARTAEFLKESGFKPPRSWSFDGPDTLDAIDTYPVIVKPSRGGGGSRDTFVAQSRRQLEILADYLNIMKEPFLVQEYVGRFDEEYTVGVLHDLDGRLINSIAIRRLMNSALNMRLAVKNQTDRTDLGEWLAVSSGVSHGLVGDFPDVRRQCEIIAAKLGARGPINIQCRFVDGVVRVFEINPRFSGTTSLRAMVGYNEPDLLLRRHVLGEEIPVRFPYKHGWIIRSLTETLLPESSPPTWQSILAGKES
jgi:carbamoyl-phosphate synthase large subunit